MDRRVLLKSSGAAALGVLALTAVESGTAPALADPSNAWVPLPNPADGGVVSPPFAKNLTAEERKHLETFDELDFEVFSHEKWDRLGESHAKHIRVHWPDGRYTDGIDQHKKDLESLFVWAPDTHIDVHPLRVAKNELTAVTGVMRGTFTKPMPDGTAPTGKAYSINMCTVGIWNKQGTMDEEFLFWDNHTFYSQIGLA